MNMLAGAIIGVAVYLMLEYGGRYAKRLWFWAKVKLSSNRQTYIETRIGHIQELLETHDNRAIQELVSIKAALSDASMPQLYIQSLSSLSKGINTLLERQEKQEQQFISLVTALNKLTSRSE